MRRSRKRECRVSQREEVMLEARQIIPNAEVRLKEGGREEEGNFDKSSHPRFHCNTVKQCEK